MLHGAGETRTCRRGKASPSSHNCWAHSRTDCDCSVHATSAWSRPAVDSAHSCADPAPVLPARHSRTWLPRSRRLLEIFLEEKTERVM